MKYVLFAISLLLIVYSGITIVKGLLRINTLSSYGAGVLVGALLLLLVGVLVLIYLVKSHKQKKLL